MIKLKADRISEEYMMFEISEESLIRQLKKYSEEKSKVDNVVKEKNGNIVEARRKNY